MRRQESLSRWHSLRICLGLGLCAGLTLPLALTGCGPSTSTAGTPATASTSPTKAEPRPPASNVRGTVRVNGKAINTGMVTFRHTTPGRTKDPNHVAQTDRGGSYSLATDPGSFMAAVECEELNTPELKKYHGVEIPIQVKGGENVINLDYPPKS